MAPYTGQGNRVSEIWSYANMGVAQNRNGTDWPKPPFEAGFGYSRNSLSIWTITAPWKGSRAIQNHALLHKFNLVELAVAMLYLVFPTV
jgi:hypothetical protein